MRVERGAPTDDPPIDDLRRKVVRRKARRPAPAPGVTARPDPTPMTRPINKGYGNSTVGGSDSYLGQPRDWHGRWTDMTGKDTTSPKARTPRRLAPIKQTISRGKANRGRQSRRLHWSERGLAGRLLSRWRTFRIDEFKREAKSRPWGRKFD